MNGADDFLQSVKRQLRKKVYHEEYMPELRIAEDLPPKVRATIKGETGIDPSYEVRIYKPTGRKVHGYYEYQYNQTITK